MVENMFIVDVYGQFSEYELNIFWHDEPRPAHAGIDALVDKTWSIKCKESEQSGAMFFNGPLVRYLGHRLEAGNLIIDAGPTNYADFLGTNFFNYSLGDEYGWELFSNPIGISATVITSDGWLLYGRRSQRVMCHPGYVHTFGGMLEPDERRGDGAVDAFAAIKRELNEELALSPSHLEQILCLGLIRDAQIRQPELIFDVRVDLKRAELEERVATESTDQEHSALVVCPDTAHAIMPFIGSLDRVAPVALGALLAHGRLCFGAQWHSSAIGMLP